MLPTPIVLATTAANATEQALTQRRVIVVVARVPGCLSPPRLRYLSWQRLR
jgi:hypothetical protein